MESLSTDWKEREISEVLGFVLMQFRKKKYQSILEIYFLLSFSDPHPGFNP